MNKMTILVLKQRLTQCNIPITMHYNMIEYILNGCPPGHFLEAVLSNNLKEACSRADDENKRFLWDYIFFLYNYIPLRAWGSEENVKDWMKKGGYNGIVSATKEEYV